MTRLAYDSYGSAIQGIRPGTVQVVTYDGSTATTNAFGARCTCIRIVSTTVSHYVVGTAPTATTSDTYLPAAVVEYVSVFPGEKIAFIKSASGGSAFVTEGAG